MPLPPGLERKLLNRLRELLTLGYSEDEIAAELGVRLGTFRQLKKTLLEFEVRDILKKPITQTFIEYMIAQENCLKDLAGVLNPTPGASGTVRELNPAVTIQGIRLKSEIFDKILQRGQELGVISKDRKVLPDEAAMGDEELKRLAEAEFQNLRGLIDDLKIPKAKIVRKKKLTVGGDAVGPEEAGAGDAEPAELPGADGELEHIGEAGDEE